MHVALRHAVEATNDTSIGRRRFATGGPVAKQRVRLPALARPALSLPRRLQVAVSCCCALGANGIRKVDQSVRKRVIDCVIRQVAQVRIGAKLDQELDMSIPPNRPHYEGLDADCTALS